MDAVQPGWYPDPEDPSSDRWWDGDDWGMKRSALPQDLLREAPVVAEVPDVTPAPPVPDVRAGAVLAPPPGGGGLFGVGGSRGDAEWGAGAAVLLDADNGVLVDIAWVCAILLWPVGLILSVIALVLGQRARGALITSLVMALVTVVVALVFSTSGSSESASHSRVGLSTDTLAGGQVAGPGSTVPPGQVGGGTTTTFPGQSVPSTYPGGTAPPNTAPVVVLPTTPPPPAVSAHSWEAAHTSSIGAISGDVTKVAAAQAGVDLNAPTTTQYDAVVAACTALTNDATPLVQIFVGIPPVVSERLSTFSTDVSSGASSCSFGLQQLGIAIANPPAAGGPASFSSDVSTAFAQSQRADSQAAADMTGLVALIAAMPAKD